MRKVSTRRRLTAAEKAARVIEPEVHSKAARRAGVIEATRRVSTTVAKTTISTQR